MTDNTELSAGTVFGGYRIERLLGRGGMGSVYAAEQVDDSRQVAVKVLASGLSGNADRERFLREGRIAASINHPNAVYVYRTEEIQGVLAIVMELVDGGTLEEKVERLGPLSMSDAITDIIQVIDGLEAAQRQGILHRDVKPANCFIGPNGEVKVGDFGLSRPVEQVDQMRITTSGMFLGTPVFSSPEQLLGESLDARADIYAVGATLYYLLTKKFPYAAANAAQLLAMVIQGTPTPLEAHRPGLPAGLNAAVLKCLARKREDRFATYESLREALRALLPQRVIPAPLGRRLMAGVVDLVVISQVAQVLMFKVGPALGADFIEIWFPSDPSSMQSTIWRSTFVIAVFALPLYFIWFGVLEGSTGWSPGKRLAGLRVARDDGSPPGIGRGMQRALLLWCPSVAGALANSMGLALAFRGGRAGTTFLMQAAHAFMVWIGFGMLFVRARAANGWRAEQDRISATRVIRRPGTAAVMVAKPRHELHFAGSGLRSGNLGAFEVFGRATADRDVRKAIDPQFNRPVWIVGSSMAAAPVPSADRGAARETALRWIGGRRTNAESWDAYAAAPGQSLRERLEEPVEFADLRSWLVDVQHEVSQRPSAQRLSVDHVWISDAGRALVLPFAAHNFPELLAPAVLPRELVNVVLSHEKQREMVLTWPFKAGCALRAICASAGNDSALSALLAQNSDTNLPMSRVRRMKLWAATVIPTIALPLAMTLGATLVMTPDANLKALSSLLSFVADTSQSRGAGDFAGRYSDDVNKLSSLLDFVADTSQSRAERELAGAYVASHYQTIIATRASAISPSVQFNGLAQTSTTAARGTLPSPTSAPFISLNGWKRADSIVLANALISPDRTASASRLVDFTWNGRIPGQLNLTWLLLFVLFATYLVVPFFACVVTAVTARRGFPLRFMGLEIVNSRGERCGRVRVLWRQIVIWTPAVGICALLGLTVVTRILFLLLPVLPLSMIYVAGLLFMKPTCSVADALSGTRIVPL